MMPDVTVHEVEFLVLQKRTMLLIIQNCQDHEKFSDGLMNFQMPVFMQRPKIIRQLYYEVLDSVISGLSNRFEPDATAVRLTNMENFLIGQREVLTTLLAIGAEFMILPGMRKLYDVKIKTSFDYL